MILIMIILIITILTIIITNTLWTPRPLEETGVMMICGLVQEIRLQDLNQEVFSRVKMIKREPST